MQVLEEKLGFCHIMEAAKAVIGTQGILWCVLSNFMSSSKSWWKIKWFGSMY